MVLLQKEGTQAQIVLVEDVPVLALEVVQVHALVDVKGAAMGLVRADVQVEQKDTSNVKHCSFCLFSSITSESVEPLLNCIRALEKDSVLDLYINSKGGVIPVVIGVYNFIKSIKDLKINTYNMGHCDSAATLLFMLGDKRYALKNSSFYMHSLQVNLHTPQTINSLKSELASLTEDTNSFLTLLAQNSKIPKKSWSSLMSDKGTLIKAKKALSLGIAGKLLENFEGI